MKKNFKYLNFIYRIIFVVILFVALVVLLSSQPNSFPLKFFTVLSGSMEPKIKLGSIALVYKTNNYNVGNIITYAPPDKPGITITHRIIDIEYENSNKTFYITKGDANEDRDPEKVNAESIVGKIIFSIPYLGFVADFVRTPVGTIVLIVVPATLYVSSEISKIIREIKKIKKQTI